MHATRLPPAYDSMQLFLLHLGESLPPWVSEGLCNGYVLMMIRAAMIGKEDQYLKRLQKFEGMNDGEIITMAFQLKKFQKEYEQHVKNEMPNLQKLIAPLEKELIPIRKKIAELKAINPELIDLKMKRAQLDDQISAIRKPHMEAILKKVSAQYSPENLSLITFGYEFYIFMNSLLSIFHPGLHLKLKNTEGYKVTQTSLIEIIKLIPPDLISSSSDENKESIDSILKQVLSLSFNFTEKELSKVIKDQIQEGDFGSVLSVNHAMYIAKQNGVYLLYDQTPPAEILEFNNETALTAAILQHFSLDTMLDNFSIGFEILHKNPNTPRMTAAEIITDMLKQRGNRQNIDDKSADGTTALVLAANFGQVDIVKTLLTLKADPNLANENGFTAAYLATTNDHIKILELLVEAKADVNYATKKSGVTPVFSAVQQKNLKALQILKEHKADFNKGSHAGITPTFLAASTGDVTLLKLLLDFNADLKHIPVNGISPLYIASQNGHREAVDFLIDQKVDVNISIAANTAILLNQAEKLGRRNFMENLLKTKNSGTIPDQLPNFTALHAAIYFGHVDVVDSLLKQGADPMQRFSGLTALELANALNQREIAEVLTPSIGKIYSEDNPAAFFDPKKIKDEKSVNVENANINLKDKKRI